MTRSFFTAPVLASTFSTPKIFCRALTRAEAACAGIEAIVQSATAVRADTSSLRVMCALATLESVGGTDLSLEEDPPFSSGGSDAAARMPHACCRLRMLRHHVRSATEIPSARTNPQRIPDAGHCGTTLSTKQRSHDRDGLLSDPDKFRQYCDSLR